MKWEFTLANGARAGIAPIGALRALTARQLGLECLPPAKDVPVVFYVSNQAALDRIRARFGPGTC
jgi:hypothetical protein